MDKTITPHRKFGRPPKYNTPEELQEKILEYFEKGMDYRQVKTEKGEVEKIPVPTILGLVLYCGFCDRASFYDLEKKPAFTHTIKRARSFIAQEYEKCLRANNVAGAIFALKNFGWTDRQDVVHTGNIKINYGHRPRLIDCSVRDGAGDAEFTESDTAEGS